MNDSALGAGEISLADAIGELRGELTEAVSKSAGKDILFEVGEVEIEFAVAVERRVGGSAGVKFWIVNAGAEASSTRSATHRLTGPLRRRTPSGVPVLP